MRTWARILIVIAAVALLSGFTVVVWPTPWRDRVVTLPSGPITARQHRFTGEVHILCVDGWHRLDQDPFVDLAPSNRSQAERTDPCLNAPTVLSPPQYRPRR